jgi:hypothetical protein
MNNSNTYKPSGQSLVDGIPYTSYSIIGHHLGEAPPQEENADFANNITILGDHFNLEGFTIASHGHRNQLPQEIKNYFKENSTIPQILKKMVRIMFGQGLSLYQEDEESEPYKRKWVSKDYADVLNWLDSWDKQGDLDSVENYLKRVIQDYFYTEGYYNQWLLNKSRRTAGAMPVRGLKFQNNIKCRLAKNGTISPNQLIKDSDCDTVIYTDWRFLRMLDIEYFSRFDKSNPFKYPTSVNYVRDRGFDEEIYAEPTFYFGLKEWIKGSNLSPKFINSYLKNSLSAKIHVKIPNAWLEKNKEILTELCKQNYERQTEDKKIIEEYAGIEIGTEYSDQLLENLVNKKIGDATSVLSGAGENQGKAFWSRTFLTEHGIEEWKFEEIPSKYKEYIDSLTSYDSTAIKRILMGLGIPPEISNVGNEGIFSSGSQIYYAYLVFLDTQGFAEDFILEDLNRAARLNFPKLQTNRVKLGFRRFAPLRQQDTNPTDRLDASQSPNNQNK